MQLYKSVDTIFNQFYSDVIVFKSKKLIPRNLTNHKLAFVHKKKKKSN